MSMGHTSSRISIHEQPVRNRSRQAQAFYQTNTWFQINENDLCHLQGIRCDADVQEPQSSHTIKERLSIVPNASALTTQTVTEA